MILYADTKTVKLLMKDQDILTVHLNADPKRVIAQVVKAKYMNVLEVDAEISPLVCGVHLDQQVKPL